MEHQICRFAKMILCDRCSNEEVSQNRFVFDVVKLSSKIEEASQNCFVLDVVNFRK